MCTFKKEVKNKTQFTGYKVAIKNLKSNKYYSPITGIEYKPGLIEQPQTTKVYLNFADVLNCSSTLNNSKYKGMTGVFKTLKGAKEGIFNIISERYSYLSFLFNNGQVVILKMTIQKTKNKNCWLGEYYNNKYWLGEYSNNEIYIGPRIRSMKEIEI